MSSSSDDDFYDALSGTLLSKYHNKDRSAREDLTLVPGRSLLDEDDKKPQTSPKSPGSSVPFLHVNVEEPRPKPSESSSNASPVSEPRTPSSKPASVEDTDDTEVRVLRLEETRRRLGEEEESCQSSSQTSSMDGLYPRPSRPFKLVEQERSSMSARVRPPDIVSSCIDPPLAGPCPPPPQPPPRRKKRNKSPTISIASNVLGINTGGVSSTVTALDEDKTRARSQGPRAIRKTEPQELLPEEMPSATQSPPEKKFFVRTKTDSGKMMSDLEILEQVTVVNLDTGERIPLSSAEEKIPVCINPLSLHIMRLTSELEKLSETDSDSDSKKSTTSSFKRRGLKFKKLLIDVKSKALTKAKSLTAKSEEVELEGGDDTTGLKMKVSPKHKGPYDFENLQLVQDLGIHEGPVWCMKFSNCGRLLATAGQDRLVRVWVLKSSLDYFLDLLKTSKVSPTNSLESVPPPAAGGEQEEPPPSWPFVPLSSYSAHTADLLDIAWSKSFFLLSSSMDRTVRLWHISRRECLCCFQHIDFVTAIAFHPRDDRYFLSGSLDGKLRLWNIPDKKVALWNEVPGPNNLITTANFCQNGKFAVVGTYDGRCIFYHTEQLKYHTQIILNKKKLGKITGIEPMPGEDKILVTSNDSRIRLYDLRDISLTCKYTGAVARSSQIKASFSHDGKFIVSGSENMFIYLWRAAHEYTGFGGARRDRNSYWEGVKAHNAVVTCAIFAPDPDLIIKEMDGAPSNYSPLGYVLASADFNGNIKVFVCRVKPKCSSLPASAIA